MNIEHPRTADMSADEQRYIIAQMIEGMTEAHLDRAIILLRQWLLEESQ